MQRMNTVTVVAPAQVAAQRPSSYRVTVVIPANAGIQRRSLTWKTI